ncbi:G-protein coupled receptor dmsr-1-like isoform X1 [Bicyclus anynana]|uniref:G-protein coupled receptor dmsr-1-like isoform X1 n=1 Tax=Bicyclus anynana TaxID=110368 RepID=A0ABM3LXE7_BICAN|nr:G-protein coupled receptor dmsr-1-like isoform X1 [Bicyclus anynana]XP_052743719.1 G-protein coupled receptor dmsr-1-like isoform X1 [Bicyclus anynana]
MSNKSQTLMEIFQEILAASGNSSDSKSINETRILTALKEQAFKERKENIGSVLVKVVSDAQSKLNLTIKPEACNYCEGDFRDVVEAYNGIHGYVSLMVCTIGVLANTMNVAVLTRRDMAAAPINRLLKWLAVADVFVMLEYVPFAIYKYLVLPETLDFRYSWAMYLLFHMHFAQILHTASICLTLSLAIWRYIAIKYSDRSHILCTERRCSVAILTSFLLPPILCIPTFMVFDIHTKNVSDVPGDIAYHVDSDNQGKLYQINFWVHAVAIKLLPCSILTVIILWLIRALYSANQHQKNLRNYSACPAAEKMVKRQHKADKRTDRTTKMLLAVLLLFLVTELPQGILGLMSGLLGKCFFDRCYNLFGELMDFLALLNGAINFILYCSMSKQFRQTFRALLLQRHLARFLPPTASHSDSHNQNTCTEKIKR